MKKDFYSTNLTNLIELTARNIKLVHSFSHNLVFIIEIVKSKDNGSGDAYKKSEFRSNPYIMLRP